MIRIAAISANCYRYPDIAWDGSTGGDFSVGYCTHASILFPTWHRPYIALYEVCALSYRLLHNVSGELSRPSKFYGKTPRRLPLPIPVRTGPSM